MKICFTELIIELSHALDYVEAELLGVQTDHGKRVAFLCALMGRHKGMGNRELLDLAGCAVMHDNALTEYVQAEYLSTHELVSEIRPSRMGIHCALGERNVQGFPFFGDMRNVILYHHENANGSGPFSKKENQVSLYSRLIHLADQLDSRFALRTADEGKWARICSFLSAQKGKMFGAEETELFLSAVTPDDLKRMDKDRLEHELRSLLAYEEGEYGQEQLMAIGGIFARIVDYKSTYTSLHSMGIAQKAFMMGAYYGLDEDMKTRLYLAGALHDIGKLAVDVNILEKPGRLDEKEFEAIKLHALVTYRILSRIHGLEEICRWASFHHEKLNGKGYPFGLDAKQLGRYERLMACLDIYQALREDRSYKTGKTHEESMAIMESMAADGYIDKELTQDVNRAFGPGSRAGLGNDNRGAKEE